MPTETTYTALSANLASVLDQVTSQQDVVVVRRKGAPDVAMLPASELAGILETGHLLSTPKNAKRLLRALMQAEKGKGK